MKLKNKIVIVTGGNSGIGYFAIERFLQEGAHVVMASRSKARAEEAIQKLQALKLPGKVEFIELDLMTLASVKKFVSQFKKQFQRLDLLVNNAGIMFGDYQLTEDGFESQMATNHFGHFALTGQLLSRLIASQGRIVNVSSIAHRRGEIDFDNLHYQKPKSYSPWGAYSRSKLANLLFTYELDRRLKKANIPVKVLAAHPGVSKTNLLFKNTKTQPLYNLMKFLVPLQSAKRGAIPTIEASMNADCKGGEYFGPSGWFEIGGKKARLVHSIPLSHDQHLAKKFFDVSQSLTGVEFSFKS
jgi:NAD(P)-dependent dehydrogenase (short-subunit alcohol dehydrogenase family)